MSSFRNAVLLKCSINGIAGEEGLGTEWLVTLLAEVTYEA